MPQGPLQRVGQPDMRATFLQELHAHHLLFQSFDGYRLESQR